MEKNYGIVVSTDQVFEDSLAMASLGDKRFIDFLLSNIQKTFPEDKKIFAMAFRDLQRMRKDFVKLVESYGFEMFVADRDDAARLARVANIFELEHVAEIRLDCPLTSLNLVIDMVKSHIKTGCDLTICHNLPLTLSPAIANLKALSLYSSMANTNLVNTYKIQSAVKEAASFYGFMIANPGFFNTKFFEAPMGWQGAGFDPFADEFTRLRLDTMENVAEIRKIIYTINKDVITYDDVIDYVLIENMQKFWDKPLEFDAKRIVADQGDWDTDEKYLEMAEQEIKGFAIDDDKFINGKDSSKEKILEVGCGHGRLVRVLSELFKEVHGTDASNERYMEARYRLRNHANVYITRNDGRSLKHYPDSSFDRCFAHGVFVHINSKTIINNYIKEMARVLKKGCRTKFDIYHGKDVFAIGPRFFGVGARYSEQEIKDVLSDAGLKLVDIDYVNTQQYAREEKSGNDYSQLPLKQMLVIGEK